ncbi:hypothetical protein FHS79_001882 [Polymorphobacter multimanifer]|uniref:Calcineurin-like phosphoesterase domain-containing protein n=1 Tax=Polymorphobacter multimanifer TaxID=1070431 RepID=A0A841L9Q8_9SPHN|nr:metallophosphoesterase [Polymorphobacter multimanifer]MBB6227703.1 hypothetical protein [Polymorphobacter multimanifer]
MSLRRLAGLAVALVLGLGFYAMAEAVQDPVVVRYRVPIVGLAAPVRVVQLSDIHAGWLDMPPSRIARIAAQANALKPDLVVLTGDYVGGKVYDWPRLFHRPVLRALSVLEAPLGVLAVPGNHDSPRWTSWVFAETPIRLLVGSFIDVGPLVVVGGDSIGNPVPPVPGLRHAMDSAPQDKPMITLSHEPDTFEYLDRRSQLHLSGHSHGRQILIPGLDPTHSNPFVSAHRRGLFRENGRWLLVSSGVGTTFVPLRFRVPPEIVVIELVPAHSVGRNSGTER